MPKTTKEMLEEVVIRYNEDAVFHARVKRALLIAEGGDIFIAAAAGVLMAEYNPQTCEPVRMVREV